MQTKAGFGTGNCYQACIASILHLDIDDVPVFATAGGGWFRECLRWFMIEQKLYPMRITNIDNVGIEGGFYIAGGPAARGLEHAVVYDCGKLAHDPHPDNTGIDFVREIELFIPCLQPPEWAFRKPVMLPPNEGGPVDIPSGAMDELKRLAKAAHVVGHGP